jgi:hypothetical protein
MPDPIFERAIARRDTALREAQEWQMFIERYQQLAGGPSSSEVTPVREAQRALSPDTALAQTIYLATEALEEAGRPMTLAALYEAVSARGLAFTGANPRDNLGARLYNSKQFVSLGKKTGWWFKDRPVPEAPEEATLIDKANHNAARVPSILCETVSSVALLPCSSGSKSTVHAPWSSVVTQKETPNSDQLFGVPKTNGHAPAVN